jgi:hydrogenase nickel insertion protein HypA
MHEFSIATILVNSLLDYQKKGGSNPGKLLEVYVRVGSLRSVSVEQLVYSYNLLVKRTSLSGSKLLVEEIQAKVSCPKCNFKDIFERQDESFHFALPSLSCPRCGSSLSLEGGDELQISKIRVQRAAV